MKRLNPFLSATLWLMLCITMAVTPRATASEKYRHIYLSQDRVCKHCVWAWVDAEHVRLSNRNGASAVYRANEIVGVSKGRFWRWLARESFHGIGYPATFTAPQAFEETYPLGYD